MKTLIILSACLLALASCNKEVPVPDPGPVYSPGPDTDPVPQTDPGDDDPSSCAFNNQPSNSIHWMTAKNLNPVG